MEIDINSTPDWIGAFATLLGAFIGAALGGFFSYKASRRAQKDIVIEEKIERIYAIAKNQNT